MRQETYTSINSDFVAIYDTLDQFRAIIQLKIKTKWKVGISQDKKDIKQIASVQDLLKRLCQTFHDKAHPYDTEDRSFTYKINLKESNLGIEFTIPERKIKRIEQENINFIKDWLKRLKLILANGDAKSASILLMSLEDTLDKALEEIR